MSIKRILLSKINNNNNNNNKSGGSTHRCGFQGGPEIPDRNRIWKCCFLRRGKNPGAPGEKPLGARTRTNNKLNPQLTPSPRIEPG